MLSELEEDQESKDTQTNRGEMVGFNINKCACCIHIKNILMVLALIVS